jgi:probable rRNA maturation factor
MTPAPLDLTVEGAGEAGLDEGALRALALAVLDAEGVAGPWALGLTFAGEDEMRALNARHRGLDEVTDVLAFPLDARDELPIGLERQLGDVVVCQAQAVRQAREAGAEPLVELRTLIVHGLLHLLGHDHETDAGDMLARQDELLALLPALQAPR